MYIAFLLSELKKYSRDSMMKFLIIYPLIFGLIGRYLLPQISESSGFSIDAYADIVIVILTLITPQMFGALIGFSILDDRDDHIFSSIKVTPLSINQFLSFRLIMVFILSFIATIFVMWFSDIGDLGFGNIVAISFLASLAAPMIGLFINALSNNKIEGFAVMKGTGIIIIFPIIALFFLDNKEFIFSFSPGFWPAKAISTIIRGEEIFNLSFNQYYFIGLIYIILLNILAYKFFKHKTHI